MSMTQRNYRAIVTALREGLTMPERVKVFNVLVPVFKADNERFKVSVFYDWLFADADDTSKVRLLGEGVVTHEASN